MTTAAPLEPANSVRVAPYDDLNWVVVEPYTYVTRLIAPGTRIVVPAGFVTDGASIPRLFWRVVPPFGRHFNAAVVHDWLYRSRPHQLSKALSDAVFSEIMARDNVSELFRVALRDAVDMFGAGAYNDEHNGAIIAPAFFPAHPPTAEVING